MNKISVADREKIQSHLAEIWKILYANGLEELECNRTPNSKQKRRMWEMHVKYNKNHSNLTEGFSLSVSDYVRCSHQIEFEPTKEEEDTWDRRRIGSDLRLKRWEKKEKRRKELEEEHQVAYWHKHFMTPYWTSGFTNTCHPTEEEKETLSYVGPQPSRFVHMLFTSTNPEEKAFSKEAIAKYMKKYGLDKEYDVNTGKKIKDTIEDSAMMNEQTEDKAKSLKDILRKQFEDGTWKDEALKLIPNDPRKSIYDYLESVRDFIKMQEEYDLHGMALYGMNEKRTKLHSEMLIDYGFDGYDEKSDIARDVSKAFDFVGECKFVNGKMKTVFWSEREAALKLAYALNVVKYADEYLKG